MNSDGLVTAVNTQPYEPMPFADVNGLASNSPGFSPDGKRFALKGIDSAGADRLLLYDGALEHLVRTVPLPRATTELHWTPDNAGISFISFLAANDNIVRLDLKTLKQTPVTDFNYDFITTYDWSPDGQLLYQQTTKVADVVEFSRQRH
jgi:Tol biopolymer transport system component